MPSTTPARAPRPRRSWRLAFAGLPLALAGCDAAGPVPLAGFGLALAGVAVLAFLLGRSTAGGRLTRELRDSRDRLRRASALDGAWRWRSDASHRLLDWSAPGQPAGRVPAAAPEALRRGLEAQRPFHGLDVRFDDALAGSRHWRLAGEPFVDQLGRFAGFEGRAEPLDAEAERRRDAAACAATLDALPGAALLLERDDGRWILRRRNPAAASRWPARATGAGFDARADEFPAEIMAALEAPEAPGADRKPLLADGWGLSTLDGPPPAVLLWERVEGTGAGATDDDSVRFTLSHDLRAPIRVVEGFTRIVKEDYGPQLDRVGNDHLDRVLGAAARMNLMIDALLDLARLSQQPLVRQRVDLSQLAGYVVEELRRQAPERSVEFEIAPGLVATGDPTLLRLVLENLLGNAWKYSARTERARVSFTRGPHGDGQAYCVRDNGAGFDPRSAERLFGLFQRLHGASEFAGHGVGLASVRRIVRRHGGEVWAESEPGRGASFYFTLAG